MKQLTNWKAAIGFLAMIATAFAHAQQPVLVGDAQINSAATTTKYGAATTLTVSSTNSALMQFNIADIVPTGTTASEVLKARLIIFTNAIATGGTVNLYPVTSSWSESSVTYATKPTISGTSASSSSIGVANTYKEFDVTNLVRNWVTTPSSNYGVALKPSGSTNINFDSKENTAASHPPQLEIVLSGPAGPAGPTGATGAKGATGATGPAGPQGPSGSLHLPYVGSGTGNSKPAFSAKNTGVYGSTPPYTPDGIAGYGGNSGSSSYSTGGTGVVGYGGPGSDTSSTNTYGGIGIVGRGGTGNPSATGSSGGFGGEFFGGDSGGGIGGFGGDGVVANAGSPNGIGLYVYSAGQVTSNTAAVLIGAVDIYGALYKSSGAFKIDHPVDPANKYLVHSFVESPDMMNVYNGNVVTDGGGTAVVIVPDWMESLNRDFRYQLTPIGQFAQAMVASEISNGKFVIKTDKGNVKVSWQVTGIRQDAWANAHRLPTEVDKNEQERGHFIHPELFGHAGEPSIAEVNHRASRPQPDQQQ